MRELPQEVRQRIVRIYGSAGRHWVESLPALVDRLRHEWALMPDGPPFADALASCVVPVRGADGEALILKLAPPSRDLAHEAGALRHWNGRGAVRLVRDDAAAGAMLLERAQPGTPLAALCDRADAQATSHAAVVMRALRRPAPEESFPALADWIAPLRESVTGEPEAVRRECKAAYALACELLDDPVPQLLLHGDLHHHNIRSAGDGIWVAIDPKGLFGPAEAEAAALIRNPRSWLLGRPDRSLIVSRRVRQLAEELGYGVDRLRGWGVVLAVLAGRWAREDGEPHEWDAWIAVAELIRSSTD